MKRVLFIMSGLMLSALSRTAEAQIPISPSHPAQVRAEPGKNPAEPAAIESTAPAVKVNESTSDESKHCGGGRWMAGVSAYYLKPSFQDNTAFLTDTLPGVNDTRQATDFAWKYTISPKIWLGYASESGLGIRAQ